MVAGPRPPCYLNGRTLSPVPSEARQTPQLQCHRNWTNCPSFGLATAICHFLNHMQNQLPIVGVHLCEKLSQLPKVASFFTPKPSHLWPIAAPNPFRSLGRLLAIVEELVHGNFEGARHLRKRFYRRNSMPVLEPRYVRAHEAGALLYIPPARVS